MRYSKIIAFILAFVMLAGIIAGCGGGKASESTTLASGQATQAADKDTVSETTAGQEEKVVSIFVDSTMSESSYGEGMRAFEKETGIKVEQNVLAAEDFQKKLNISLMSGDTTDCFRNDNPIGIDDYARNGISMSLDELAKEYNYDLEATYGKYLMKTDGKIYSIPYLVFFWTVFYNKKLFDEAGVPYPSGKWTWDDYIATAKKLTNPEKKIYGSYMLDYDNYKYLLAGQKMVNAYKEDGTSNYDDQAFKDSLMFFKDLGDVHKVQPSFLEFRTKKLAWDGFMSGKYGMHFISTWYFALLGDSKNYPRDWKFGVAQTPVPADGQGDTNLGNAGYMLVNKNAAHPRAAFKFVTWVGENMYKYSKNIPPRQDLSVDEWNTFFKDIADQTGNDVTTEDIYKALIDNGLGFTSEKILGPIASQYSSIIDKEAELYLVGQQSLEDTVKNIKTRADEEIARLGK